MCEMKESLSYDDDERNIPFHILCFVIEFIVLTDYQDGTKMVEQCSDCCSQQISFFFIFGLLHKFKMASISTNLLFRSHLWRVH